MLNYAKLRETPSCFRLAVFIALSLMSVSVFSQERMSKPLLSGTYPYETLRDILIPRQSWHPFPTSDEREPWMSLPEATRKGHIERGEQAMKRDWPALPATLFLEYVRTGNRSNYERPRSERRSMLRDLVIAECMEGKGRFIDDIVNGIWAICEESSWCVSAHIGRQKIGRGLPDTAEPIVALFSAQTAGLLAWTVYLLGDQLDSVSPLIRMRVQREIENRVMIPFLEQNFYWMGFDSKVRSPNNWNPWCNSNCLTIALLLEKDEGRRIDLVHKALRSLDRFIGPYPSHGGCNEGPSYWGHAGGSLFDCLELLYSATNGKIDVYSDQKIQEIGRFVYRAHINDNYFVNIGDCGARVGIPGDLVFSYGRRIGDEHLSGLGAYAVAKRRAQNPCVSGSMGRQLNALFNLSELLPIIEAGPTQPLLRDVWLGGEDMQKITARSQGLQLMAARTKQGSENGLYVAAWGGHNEQSHNHNDVGNFIIYANGLPMIIDVGVASYTAKTFSGRRYEIWTMQSAYHNLPTINGVMQGAGMEFAARDVTYKSGKSFAQIKMDIAGAYPPDGGVDSWIRTIRLNRGKNVQVVDSYELKNAPRELTLSLMTPCDVILDKPGQLTLKEVTVESARPPVIVRVQYDANKLTPNLETIDIKDSRLKYVWRDHLTRIVLRADSPPLRDTWRLRITQ